MTTITMKKDKFGFDTIIVNGRLIDMAGRFDSIEKQGSYTWTGKADGRDFVIYGGTKSGGRTNEWFVRWDTLGDFEIKTNSAAECVRVINNS